jgi:hypothetical protein
MLVTEASVAGQIPQRVAATMTGIRYAIGTRLNGLVKQQQHDRDEADARQGQQQRQHVLLQDALRRQLLIRLRCGFVPALNRRSSRFPEFSNDRPVRIQGYLLS